jgi:predicted amidohydrolase
MQPKPVLRLGVAQIESRADIAANLAGHLEAIAEARARKVDVLLFPELSLAGYRIVPDVLLAARPADCEELSILQEATGDMVSVVGFIEEDAAGLFYNSVALLGAGSIRHAHRKLNLPSYGGLEEGKHYAAGDRLEIVGLAPPWQAAPLICADAWNPALPWLAAVKGANLMLIPVASSLGAVGEGFDNPAGWETTLRHIAMTYGQPVVMANFCGADDGVAFWGGSRILDARGRDLVAAGAGPALIHADVDFADIRQARYLLPTIRDAAPRLVSALLNAALAARMNNRETGP